MKETKCLFCSSNFRYKTGSSSGKYCSNSCQQSQQYKEKIHSWLDEGKNISSKIVKRYLMEKNPTCSSCGISSWQNLPIVLELEHKDGNSENNNQRNVCLLCPNCHSQTLTYKNRNKGKGRHYRRKRYYLGKSY